MSVEATLKQQARQILAKDNWIKSIMGFLCVLSVWGITFLVVDGSTYLITDDILSKPVNLAIMVAIALVGVIGFVLLSPIYTGYIKFISECKAQKTGDVKSIIYYFSKERYFKTILLNISLMIRYALLIMLCVAPTVAFLVLMKTMPDYETGFKIGALWAGIIGGLALIILSRFYVMVQYLYVSDFSYRKEKELVKASRYMVKKNLGKIMSLYISFIPYLVLCFFMIPLVFVYPYFKQTAILSYSYIYELEKDTPTSPYYNKNAEYQQAINSVEENTENLDNTQLDNEEIKAENDVDTEINDDNTQENTFGFDNNQQTNQNAFIPDENSDIII